MKQGDTITTKDGTKLIAVPYADTDAPCNGCFFYKMESVMDILFHVGVRLMVNLYL